MVDRIAIKTIYEGNIGYGFDDMKGTFFINEYEYKYMTTVGMQSDLINIHTYSLDRIAVWHM